MGDSVGVNTTGAPTVVGAAIGVLPTEAEVLRNTGATEGVSRTVGVGKGRDAVLFRCMGALVGAAKGSDAVLFRNMGALVGNATVGKMGAAVVTPRTMDGDTDGEVVTD